MDNIIPISSPPAELRNAALFVRAFSDPTTFFRNLGQDNPYIIIGDPKKPTLLLNDAAAISRALGNDFIYKGGPLEVVHRIMGNGLVTTDGEMWRRQRRLIQPHFVPSINHERMLGQMVAATDDMFSRLQSQIDRREEIDFRIEFPRLAFDVLQRAAFDECGDNRADTVQWALGLFLEESRIRFWQIKKEPLDDFYERPDIKEASHTLRAAAAEMVQRRRNSIGDHREGDLLTGLIKHYDGQNSAAAQEELMHQVLTIYLAGQETTGHAMSALLVAVGLHPYLWDIMQREADDVVGNDTLKLNHVAKLDHTTRIINENLRMNPTIPAVTRIAPADTLVPLDDGRMLDVKAGQRVSISPSIVHWREKYYPNRAKFDHDRFLPAAMAARPKHAFLPYVYGPRNCIGGPFAQLEQKVVYCKFAGAYDVEVIDANQVRMTSSVTTRPDRAVKARLTPRHPAS